MWLCSNKTLFTKAGSRLDLACGLQALFANFWCRTLVMHLFIIVLTPKGTTLMRQATSYSVSLCNNHIAFVLLVKCLPLKGRTVSPANSSSVLSIGKSNLWHDLSCLIKLGVCEPQSRTLLWCPYHEISRNHQPLLELVSSYLCLTLDLFMLQNTALCPVHEYMNICMWVCEALPNRALRRVNFLLLIISGCFLS